MVFIFRQALESEYVSNNLNKWVDLIFGIKSGTGKEAIKACNLFHKLTYSHTLKELSDDADEKTMEQYMTQVYYYGQTPMQLWDKKEKHPQRQNILINLRLDLEQITPL